MNGRTRVAAFAGALLFAAALLGLSVAAAGQQSPAPPAAAAVRVAP